MTHTRLTLNLLFIFALVCPMALAQPPVLFFDANTQDDDDEAWANSGSAWRSGAANRRPSQT